MNRELLEIFFSEAAELIESMVSGLLILEKNPKDQNQLNSVFRAAHTMKGNAATVGLERLVTFAHIQENALDLIRQGRLLLTGSVISTLLQSVDVLQELLEAALADTPPVEDRILDMEAHLVALGQTLVPPPASAPAVPSAQAVPPAADQPVRPFAPPTPDPDQFTADDPGQVGPRDQTALSPLPGPGDENLEDTPARGDHSLEPDHSREGKVGPQSQAAMGDTIRLNVDLIDRLMATAGELVLGRNQLCRLLEDWAEETAELTEVLQRLSQVATDIQEHTMGMRMQQLAKVFGRLPRVVRDVSRRLGLEVALDISGDEVELDKSIVDALFGPLTLLVANCIEHGREQKDAGGSRDHPGNRRITIQAGYQEGQVTITVTDHGRGLDPNRVAERALRMGLVDSKRLRLMNENEKLNLIFRPGWSAIPGGPAFWNGMDQVKGGIEAVGGNLHIESRADRGVIFRLLLPLTLAIIPSLIVNAGGHCFAIPQRDVVEMIHLGSGLDSGKIEKIGDALVFRRRNRLLPLVNLTYVLHIVPEPVSPSEKAFQNSPLMSDAQLTPNNIYHPVLDREAFVVVLRCGPDRFGLIVDGLTDTEEIVVKPLSPHVKTCRAYSGTTILGDGSVTIILNAGGLAEEAGLDFGEVSAEEQRRAREQARRQGEVRDIRTSFLVFANAPGELFALPTANIVRLEKAHNSGATRIGRKEFFKLQQGGLPILRLEQYLPVTPADSHQETFYLIVPRTQGPSVGIFASRLLDIFDLAVHLEQDQIKRPGLLGTGVVDDNLITFLDLDRLLAMFGRDSTMRPLATAH